MNKKLIAVAIAGTLGAVVALPANADIKIGAKFYPAIVLHSGAANSDGGVPTSTLFNARNGKEDANKIEAFNSMIRFSGEIDAGGGLKGFFQIEGALDFDDGGRDTFPNRNSAVGLKGGFGRIMLGNWDTPFKKQHFKVGSFGVSAGSPLSGSSLGSRTPFDGGRFHLRQKNSIQYWSPDLGGFKIKAAYGPDENKTATKDAVLTSFSVSSDFGPVKVSIASETHEDFFDNDGSNNSGSQGVSVAGTPTASSDSAVALTVIYKLSKKTKISFDYETLDYENTGAAAGSFAGYDRTGMQLGFQTKLNKWSIGATYYIADEGDCSLVGGAACSTSGLDATKITLVGVYNLAKRLDLYASYAAIDNGASAAYDLGHNTKTGADPSAISFGIKAVF